MKTNIRHGSNNRYARIEGGERKARDANWKAEARFKIRDARGAVNNVPETRRVCFGGGRWFEKMPDCSVLSILLWLARKSSRWEEGNREGRVEQSVSTFVQKPRPRFHVSVQTGRGEQPLVGVWRIGVDAAPAFAVTGSAKPSERINFFHTCRFLLWRRCGPEIPRVSPGFSLEYQRISDLVRDSRTRHNWWLFQ